MREEVDIYYVVGERNWGPPTEDVLYTSYSYDEASDWLDQNNFVLSVEYKDVKIIENYEYEPIF